MSFIHRDTLMAGDYLVRAITLGWGLLQLKDLRRLPGADTASGDDLQSRHQELEVRLVLFGLLAVGAAFTDHYGYHLTTEVRIAWVSLGVTLNGFPRLP